MSPRFPRFESFVDVSTIHITVRDMQLLAASPTPGSDSPVLVWGNYEGFGCFVYVQEEAFDTMEYDRSKWPFSQAFWDVLAALQADGVFYARFERDGQEHDSLPKVWEE